MGMEMGIYDDEVKLGLFLGMNLRRHHVLTFGRCRLCWHGQDSTIHSLFFCPALKKIWKNQDWTYWLHFARFGSTLELCIWMQTNLAQEEFEAFATHTWLCWKERQRVIHGNGECSQIKMVEGAGKYLENFQKARLIHKNSSREVETEGLMKWIPPPKEKLRLDVDACVNFGKGLFGIGGVIRNWAGDPLLVFGKKIVNAGSILELELRAIKEGLEIACNAKVIPQFVASDSLLAIQAVIEDKEVGGYIEFWASKIKQILQSIGECSIFHVNRSANHMAHCIAKFASSSQLPFVWEHEDFPDWVKELVMLDSTQLN
ncbi:hypothetical protein DH2020_032225 [Rehmannia glutinosa]|uniref:RNase H type-1 domain-containing protein n=1 Tax=Rehmannia glutinosa TaxID=99300 RepID=A0ABR0VFZ5_REHGL